MILGPCKFWNSLTVQVQPRIDSNCFAIFLRLSHHQSYTNGKLTFAVQSVHDIPFQPQGSSLYKISIKRQSLSLQGDGGMWVEVMSFIPMALNFLYLYLQPRLFSVVQASIFKFLHEQLFPYFKFNFSEIKFFFLPLHPNLLLLLPQPPTPNLFLSQTPPL